MPLLLGRKEGGDGKGPRREEVRGGGTQVYSVQVEGHARDEHQPTSLVEIKYSCAMTKNKGLPCLLSLEVGLMKSCGKGNSGDEVWAPHIPVHVFFYAHILVRSSLQLTPIERTHRSSTSS